MAAFVAILALLLQQGLLPVFNFAIGAQLSGSGHEASAGINAHHHDQDGGPGQGDGSHGPCHFCRILGASLPPPPVAELFRLAPTRIVFAHPASTPPATAWTSRAHGARAPPTSSNRQPMIAIV